jgi:hypothetical protein
MLRRWFISLAVLSFCALTACSDSTGTSRFATIRFGNATNSSLDLATNGTIATGNSSLGFGGSGSCTLIDVFTPALEVRQAGTTNVVSFGFSPSFVGGNSYIVVAYPGFGGATQFASINTSIVAAAGQAGLRVVNLAAGSGIYDVYVTAPGAALGTASATSIGFGTTSGLINVAAGAQLVRLTSTGTQTVAINAGNLTFTAGQNAVLVIAPPAPGTTALRTFLVAAC